MSNNETFGMSCEKAICMINDEGDMIEENRVDMLLVNKLIPLMKVFLQNNNINKLSYVGKKGSEKDFIDEINNSYSIKSNNIKGEKVCPQVIGQCTREKFKEKLYQPIMKEEDPDYILLDETIKSFIITYPHLLFIKYFEKTFGYNYLIHIKKTENNFDINLYSKKILKLETIKDNMIIFTKNLSNWNESNTMKIQMIPSDKKIIDMTKKEINKHFISIGEFQIHKNRDCIKFRFNFTNLLIFLRTIKL